jgi:hypothetical protein
MPVYEVSLTNHPFCGRIGTTSPKLLIRKLKEL